MVTFDQQNNFMLSVFVYFKQKTNHTDPKFWMVAFKGHFD